MRYSGKTLFDPAPDAEWDLWYQDNFDYECPRQIEASGVGLLKGLTELWARYLRETVQANGQKGFSQFNLWWKQESRSIEIVGDWRGAVRLRTWIVGKHGGNQDLLMQVALTHCHLILAGQTSEPILEEAGTVVNRQEFERQLLSVRNRK